MIRKTIVVSAFPACGKTYACEHNKQYLAIDCDSSKFSWVYDENGNSTDVRNPDFPNNYIEYIKENIGKVDIIFVSSHLAVRQALQNANINFVTVYPQVASLNEWVGRMYRRGDSKEFIQFIIDNWDSMMRGISYMGDEPHGTGIIRLASNEYIDIGFLISWNVGNN